MSIEIRDFFLRLVRLGIGGEAGASLPMGGPLSVEDWQALEELANEQGLLGVMLDGVEKLPRELRPEKKAILQSIGQLIQSEQQYAVQEHAAAEMALLLHQHGIRTYVLKGAVVAECYPKPEHRRSVDMDCFLVNDNNNQGSLRSKSFENLTENLSDSTLSADSKLYTLNSQQDIWERGNRVLEEQGFEVRRDFYKNSTVVLPGLTVENHRYLTPFRGNRTLRRLEKWLQAEIAGQARSEDEAGCFEGTWLYRPPVMVSALFLIEHAYSHFLHEGLTWRLVLDWIMFCRKHRQELYWQELESMVDEFGFRRFYDSYVRLGKYLLGELPVGGLQPMDLQILSDIWSPLDLHDSVTGWRGKLALAGNTWRARWKYRQFTDMSWLKALWIQAKGVLLEKEVRL